MIPVLIAPAYNRHDLLQRMLLSIDHQVGRTLIADNARGLLMKGPIEDFNPDLGEVTIFRPPFTSLGYGGTINFGISQTFAEPWWMWASNDVQFLKGTLDKVVELMTEADEPRRPRVVTGGFTWGAMNHEAVMAAGLVDEWSFWPIYFDDNDFHRRCKLGGVDWVEMQGIRHGDDEHPGSATILSDPKLRERNHESFVLNRDAYIEKWGGLPGEETFATPWGKPLPLWAVRPDPSGRAKRVW